MKGQFLAFLGGAIAGAAVALLLAPKSGEELREDIKGYVDDELKKGRRKVSDVGHRVADSVYEVVEGMAGKADGVAEKAARTARKVQRAAAAKKA